MSDYARMMVQLMAEGETKRNDEKPLPTKEGQWELLVEFDRGGQLAKGDQVRRNAQGKLRYRFPSDRQLARVVCVYDQPVLDEDGKSCTGELAVVVDGDGQINVYPVDLRYYEKMPGTEKKE